MSTVLDKVAYTFDDVLLKPQYSDVISRNDVDTSVEIAPGFKLNIPLIATNMEVVISEELCIKISEYGGLALIHQFQSVEKEVDMLKAVKAKGARVGASIGATGDYMERAQALIENGADIILIDTPHADSKNMTTAIINFKSKFGTFPIIAGTVATKEGARNLFNAGADALKVGVGAGHGCLTRINAGVGVPQLTAVLECAEVAKEMGKVAISDGGINHPGDFAKAIAAGAMAIQTGRTFASTDEANSELVERDGKKYKKYHGSASLTAKQDRMKNDPKWKKDGEKYVEGIEGLIPYEGSLKGVFDKFSMGLRSAMSYTGAFNIKEFQDKAIFIPITTSGSKENGLHGVIHKS